MSSSRDSPHFFERIAVFCFLATLSAHPLSAADWQVQILEFESQPVRLSIATKRRGIRRVRIHTEDGKFHRLSNCSKGICAAQSNARLAANVVPRGALPDAIVTSGEKKAQIVSAWLIQPTLRYPHAALGDAVEASALLALDRTKKAYRFILGTDSVFEDRKVRLVDLDQDKKTEIIVVRSYLDKGAALTLLNLRANGLAIVAETPPLGAPNRWLNPAAIADFDGDGRKEIALVTSPHKNGVLEFWGYRDRKLFRKIRLTGFSNHVFGSAVLNISAVGDFNGDHIADLALPDHTRQTLRIISFADGQALELARLALPGRVVTQIIAVKDKTNERPILITGLENGKVALFSQARPNR